MFSRHISPEQKEKILRKKKNSKDHLNAKYFSKQERRLLSLIEENTDEIENDESEYESRLPLDTSRYQGD